MNGWRYDWVDALPIEVYEVVIEEMEKHLAKRREVPE